MAKKTKPGPSILKPEEAPALILKLLQKIDSQSLMASFRLFIEACNLTLDDMPALLDRADKGIQLEGGALNTPEEMERWKAAGLGGITPATQRIYAEAFAILMESTMEADGTYSYFDAVGEVYMSLLEGARWNQDQYYTPSSVCDLMARMNLTPEEIERQFHERCKEALYSDPLLQAVVLAFGITAQAFDAEEDSPEHRAASRENVLNFRERLWPLFAPHVQAYKIYDPAVGSGRFLLAAAKQVPRWLIDIGFVRFYGNDINQLAVRMCQLNMKIYAMGGGRHPASGEAPIIEGAVALIEQPVIQAQPAVQVPPQQGSLFER